jgi:hypothetical protein
MAEPINSSLLLQILDPHPVCECDRLGTAGFAG